MSVMIYMTVTVDGEQVTPVVHISSFQAAPWSGQGGVTLGEISLEGVTLGEISLEDVRFGTEVAQEIIGFAERLKRESS